MAAVSGRRLWVDLAILLMIISFIMTAILSFYGILAGSYLVAQETFSPQQESYLKELFIKQDSSDVEVIIYEREVNPFDEFLWHKPPYYGTVYCQMKVSRPYYDQMVSKGLKNKLNWREREVNDEYAVLYFYQRINIKEDEIIISIEQTGQKDLIFTTYRSGPKERINITTTVCVGGSVSLLMFVTGIYIIATVVAMKKKQWRRELVSSIK